MQSLCIHEMIIRAFKHILQAVIASVIETEDLAAVIAATLNMMLGFPENDEPNEPHGIDPLVWRWLELFLKNRYEWEIGSLNYKDVRKITILRGLCHKVFQICFLVIRNEHNLGMCGLINAVQVKEYKAITNSSFVIKAKEKQERTLFFCHYMSNMYNYVVMFDGSINTQNYMK